MINQVADRVAKCRALEDKVCQMVSPLPLPHPYPPFGLKDSSSSEPFSTTNEIRFPIKRNECNIHTVQMNAQTRLDKK